jgi:hypothetical protein
MKYTHTWRRVGGVSIQSEWGGGAQCKRLSVLRGPVTVLCISVGDPLLSVMAGERRPSTIGVQLMEAAIALTALKKNWGKTKEKKDKIEGKRRRCLGFWRVC